MATLQITLRNRIEDLGGVCDLVSRLGRENDLPTEILFDIDVVLDELLSNIIKYGYSDDAPHEIRVTLSANSTHVDIHIVDDGKAFDPLAAPGPALSLPLAERPVGGLGLHVVRKLMNDVKYQRENNHNYLFLKKLVVSSGKDVN